MTGQRTFPGDEALTIYNAVTAGEYLPVEQLVPELPERIIQCVDGCLALDRDERIPNCSTILEVLSGQRTWSVSPHPIPTEAIVERLHDDVPLMQVAGPDPEDDFTADELIGIDENVPEDDDDALVTPPRRKGWILGIATGIFVLLIVLGGGLFAANQLMQPVAVAVKATSDTVNLVEETSEKDVNDVAEIATRATSETPATPMVTTSDEDKGATDERPVDDAEAPRLAPEKTPELKPTVRRAPSHKPSPRRKRPGVVAVDKEVKLLSSPPNAALLVDGKEVGRTNKKMLLKSGTHRVIVTSGDQEGSFTISVTKEGANKWCYDFASDQSINGSCPRR